MKMGIGADVRRIAELFNGAGYSLYVVGGAVRDYVMGLEPKDIDLATDAMPERVLEILGGSEFKHKLQGEAFGVVVVYTEQNKEGYEIATFRRDVTTGRKPVVELGVAIDEDVQRRDFTMNALFYDLATDQVIDLVGGIADIEAGIVRAVGNPYERFTDDRLRILRAIRFASRMNFTIEPSTSDAISNTDLGGISSERVVMEFVKALATESSNGEFMRLLADHGLLGIVFPGLAVSRVLLNGTTAVMLAGVLMNNAPGVILKRLVELSWPTEVARAVAFLVSSRGFDGTNVLEFKNKMLISGVVADEMVAVGANEPMARALEIFSKTVDGNDLMAEGLVGREIGLEMARREDANFAALLGIL